MKKTNFPTLLHYFLLNIGAASCAAALVSHPFDLTKVRLQTTQGANSQGMIGTMINVARHEGIFALYTGLSASLLRQGTYSTVRFGTYDILKEKFGPKDGSKLCHPGQDDRHTRSVSFCHFAFFFFFVCLL